MTNEDVPGENGEQRSLQTMVEEQAEKLIPVDCNSPSAWIPLTNCAGYLPQMETPFIHTSALGVRVPSDLIE